MIPARLELPLVEWLVRPAAPAYQLDAALAVLSSAPLNLPLKLFACQRMSPDTRAALCVSPAGAVPLTALPLVQTYQPGSAGAGAGLAVGVGLEISLLECSWLIEGGTPSASQQDRQSQPAWQPHSALLASQRLAVPLATLLAAPQTVLDVALDVSAACLRLPCILTCKVWMGIRWW
jgi:hypothetical protein